MAEEPKKDQSEDIASILSDLDTILSDAGGVLPASEPSKEAPPPKAPPKVDLSIVPKSEPVEAEAPKIEPPKVAAPKIEPPKVAAPKIEPPKVAAPKTEPPKVAAPKTEPPQLVPPAVASSQPEAPVPAAAAAIEGLPADAPKDQIRRVAYVHTVACAEAQKGLAVFLSSAARTISKKPLFLRAVLSHEVGNSSDPNAILEKAKQAKAVAILAVVEGWPTAKIDELSEACSRAGLLFRSVASADVQKKSTAVDIIVDMMLLSGEA